MQDPVIIPTTMIYYIWTNLYLALNDIYLDIFTKISVSKKTYKYTVLGLSTCIMYYLKKLYNELREYK